MVSDNNHLSATQYHTLTEICVIPWVSLREGSFAMHLMIQIILAPNSGSISHLTTLMHRVALSKLEVR